MLLLMYFQRAIVINSTLKQIESFYILLVVWSILGLVLTLDSSFDLKRFIGILFIIVIIPFISTIVARYSIENLLRVILILHLIPFFLQITLYSIFDLKIDYLRNFTGEEQRFYGGSFINPLYGKVYRPGGLFNEPGTYATHIAPFVSLFILYLNNNKINKVIIIISLLSLIMSFSVYGIIFAAIIILYVLRISRFIKFTATISIISIIVPYFSYRFIQRRSLGLNDGFGERMEFLTLIYKFLMNNASNFVFGSNLLSLDKNFSAPITYNDIGLIFYLLYFVGIPLTFYILYVLYKSFSSFSRNIKATIIILLISKASLFTVSFVFTLLAMLQQAKENERKL